MFDKKLEELLRQSVVSTLNEKNLLKEKVENKKEKKVINRYSNAFFFDTADYLCPAGKCKYSVDGEDAYNDALHLTVKGAMLLNDGFKEMLQIQVK